MPTLNLPGNSPDTDLEIQRFELRRKDWDNAITAELTSYRLMYNVAQAHEERTQGLPENIVVQIWLCNHCFGYIERVPVPSGEFSKFMFVTGRDCYIEVE